MSAVKIQTETLPALAKEGTRRAGLYQDIFTDSDLPREPRIMKDGTSIRWPRDWTPEMAAAWRHENNLESPHARRARFRIVEGP